MDKKKVFLFKKMCEYLPDDIKCKDYFVKAMKGELDIDKAMENVRKEYGDIMTELALKLALDEIKLSVSTFRSLFRDSKTSLEV